MFSRVRYSRNAVMKNSLTDGNPLKLHTPSYPGNRGSGQSNYLGMVKEVVDEVYGPKWTIRLQASLVEEGSTTIALSASKASSEEETGVTSPGHAGGVDLVCSSGKATGRCLSTPGSSKGKRKL